MPVHDVEQYLDVALASVLDQELTDFELVVVDDGSTDGTRELLDLWGARDARIRVLSQVNAGPSAARNHGVRAARGELLTFVDGDDRLPPQAWQVLAESLARTGSDFVVGALERFDDHDQRVMTARMRANHAQPRERATLEDRPELLADVYPVNKMFRRRFWDRLGLRFPENLSYEDQPVMTRAFLAGRFDVVEPVVYHYRIRADRTSLTQRRHQLLDLRDRMETKRMAVASVVAHGSESISEIFFRHVLPVDMWEYFRAAPTADATYWAELRAAVLEFWNDETVPFSDTDVPLRQRLMGWLVSEDRREDLVRLLDLVDAGALRVVEEDGVRKLDHPWRHEPGIPRGCVVLRARR